MNPPSRLALLAALGAVYLIWGSTYLAIKFAVETLPPFLMAGVRFFTAGALLYLWMRWRGEPRPTLLHWGNAAIVGGCLILGGNGGVVWAAQYVPSGIIALMIATVPLWMVLLEWMRGVRPNGGVIGGVLLGLVGMVILIEPGELQAQREIPLGGTVILLFAAFSWAVGSIYARRASLPSSALLATGMEMIMGGALQTLVGLLMGEWGRLELGAVSWRSALAFLYLIVFGSWVGFSAYIWLLRVTTAAIASTYAYVNPVVAVLLGWALAGESFSERTLLAAAMIVLAVALITFYSTRR
ncbi:MAG: drug/metabolite exporter YedA [Candidatus Bipolaricaulota bacterium]|nr:drug/metabolite exporter YedA [Candidatus Bipolaricaulota bacterium]MCS7274728.1 drug/metabolite exporter YedA [Candidatus Bipolaricaulota bacterium]MDW8110007.1 drug/metabolite exporter YedA [Candidatus Bipolaricaulota bacterium]MDW8328921.1 drug/metabolite exporter YedA [Candidatus Bipolaricaulota bacterium]